jgi:hypothetical protein
MIVPFQFNFFAAHWKAMLWNADHWVERGYSCRYLALARRRWDKNFVQ